MKKIAFCLVSIAVLSGCATTAQVDSLPLTVMANIDSIDNKEPLAFEFAPCKQKICNKAGLGGLKIGGKYAVIYSPNQSVHKLYQEYFQTKFFNTDKKSNNKLKVELLSVTEDHEAMSSGSDFFKSPDDISVTYSFSLKMKVTYPDDNGSVKSFPVIARKTLTSTQSEIKNDIKRGVSDAIGLSIIRFDKALNKSKTL